MGKTVSVLALDAADYALLREWDCENILLQNHREISTFSHTFDRPYTPEVWATVATGNDPEDHGIEGKKGNWENPALKLGATLATGLPESLRTKLGSKLEDLGFNTDDATGVDGTVFEQRAVTQWPGVTEASNFREAQAWLSDIHDGALSDNELLDRLLANTGTEFGWLGAMSRSQKPIVGVHSHILDVAGHVYSSRSDELREYYLIVDQMVGTLSGCCDELIIISDHGMEVEALDDPDPGKHSWRATISTTLDGDLPDDLKQVSKWLESQVAEKNVEESSEELDAPVEHLRDLGYFS